MKLKQILKNFLISSKVTSLRISAATLAFMLSFRIIASNINWYDSNFATNKQSPYNLNWVPLK
eukprot:scaffold10809_cov223-Skeletonema_menzelii.AAC.1